jgi:glycine/D-amino acid oxidase-like deaminating enzyme
MDLLSSRPFWPIRDGLPATFPPLAADVRCEVAVIGAGVTGALVAWHLAEAGIDAVVLDRREVAHGSTAGSTSLLQYELDVPLHRLARRFGDEFAAQAYRRCRAAIGGIERLVRRRGIECGFQRRRSLLLASRRAHLPALQREFTARAAAGLDVEWWPRARLRRESTLPHPAAILSADGAQVDAYRLAYGLLMAAREKGAQIFEHTAVTRRKYHARGVRLLTSRGATVRARHLVIATGYEAGALLPERTTVLHSTYALVSEPVAAFDGWPADGCLIWETARPYLYLSTTSDRRCLIGGYDEPFRDPRARDALLARKTAALERRFRQLLPRIPLETATSWAGTFAETASGLPLIGRHGRVPHTWFALGYGGNGITFSLIAAEILRAEIQGRLDSDAPLFAFGREAALPPI